MRSDRRRTVRFLVAVAVVCGLIAGVLALIQIVPDASGESAAYAQDWTLDIREGDHLTVDLTEVSLVLRRGSGDQLTARFEGTRKADHQGNLPEIRVIQEAGRIDIRETHQEYFSIINIGPWNNGRLRGTLILEIPDLELGEVKVQGFSGKQEVSGLLARSITLDSSSGVITAQDLETREKLSITSFFGGLNLTNLTSGPCALESSSGGITVETLRADQMTVLSFGGRQDLRNIEVQEKLTLDVSNGGIALTEAQAGAVEATSFSGGVKMTGLTTDDLRISVSSGTVEAQLEQMADIVVESFSGGVTLRLPEDSAFDYAIETFSGKVNVDFDTRVSTQDGHDRAGTVGGGGDKVTVSTSSGGVSIVPNP